MDNIYNKVHKKKFVNNVVIHNIKFKKLLQLQVIDVLMIVHKLQLYMD